MKFEIGSFHKYLEKQESYFEDSNLDQNVRIFYEYFKCVKHNIYVHIDTNHTLYYSFITILHNNLCITII